MRGPVGVEDADHPDVEPVLAVVVEEQGLGAALAFVVAGARADWVHAGPSSPRAGGAPPGRRRPRWWRPASIRAPVRLASPSMLIAPCTLVLVVWTGSCW